MDTPAHIIQWGFIQISVPNLIGVAVMVAIFMLALVLPFPGHGDRQDTTR